MVRNKWCVLLGLLLMAQAGFSEQQANGGQRCVSLTRIKHTEVLDNQTILFHMRGKKTLVNRLPRKCSGLGFHKAFSYKVSIGRLCNTDIIRVYEGDYFGAACGLGLFELYEKPSPENEA